MGRHAAENHSATAERSLRPGRHFRRSALGGVTGTLTRPAGALASSALLVAGALGGAVALTQPALSAQAAEAAPADQAERAAGLTDGTGVPLTVVVDGQTHELSTAQPVVGAALSEAGIVVDGDDIVSAPLSGGIPREAVTIARVSSELAAEQQVDAHGTREVPDANLIKGERRVTTEGVDGVTQVVSTVTTQDGSETGREELARVVVSAKVDEVVAVGTKEPAAAPAAPAAAPARQAAPAAPAPAPQAPPAAPAPSSSSATATAPAAPAAPAPSSASTGSPKAIAAQLVADRGWSADQMQCLDRLWTKESNWSVTADNPTSSAYGIPQALPGSKMASAGADWATNPATQIRWGLGYISDRYGTPCSAWGHSQANNWY